MRALQKLLLLFVVGLLSTNSNAAEFPSASTTYSGNDRVHTSSGASCSSYVGSNTRVELGGASSGENDGIAFFRLVIPIGVVPKRVDCNKLYLREQRRQDLELRKLEIEVQLLEKQLEGGESAHINNNKGNDW